MHIINCLPHEFDKHFIIITAHKNEMAVIGE